MTLRGAGAAGEIGELMSTLSLLATLMFLVQGSPAAPHADNYAVQLDRPAVVGEHYLATGSVQHLHTFALITGESEKHKDERSTLRYELAVRVLEVGPTRHARRAVLTVRRFTREAGGVTTDLFAAGTTIDARLDGGKRVFEVGGKSVESQARQALIEAVDLTPEHLPTDDEVLGSRQRRSIGESWPTSSDAMTRKYGNMLDPQTVAGRVTLVARREVGQIPCLEYHYKVEARSAVPTEVVPPGFDMKMSQVTIEGSTLVPLDPSLPVMGRDLAIEMDGRAEGTVRGVPARAEIRARKDYHLERKPLPSAPAS
jgi:hypothetical protein